MVEHLNLNLSRLETPVPRQYLEEFLENSRGQFKGKTVLDVGAGLSPHRDLLESFGLSYVSHDFSLYDETKGERGFVTRGWDYPNHDIVCDVLEIPENRKYDLVVCTEVLEHVPDPQATFRKLRELMAPGGQVFISVPAMSFVHQAPFYFNSGLSTYWFEFWASEMGLEVVRLISIGDYSDFIAQELHRIFYSETKWSMVVSSIIRLLVRRQRFYTFVRGRLRKRLRAAGEEILTSAPLNTIFIGALQGKS